jgi:hypothetical protein
MERIREAKTPTNIKLVTSDGEIRRAAQARRIEAISSQEFAETLTRPPPSQPRRDGRENIKLSKDEIKEWMRVFRKGPPAS